MAAGDVRADVDFVLPAGAATPRTISLERVMMTAPALRVRPDSVPGRGVVRGRVTSTNGLPVPNAQVTLTNDTRLAGQSAQTADGDGEFEFVALPAATYRLQAFKPGFSSPLTAPGTSLQAAFNSLPSVEVVAAETRDGVDVRLVPSSAVTGRLLDEFDDPLPGVHVQLFRMRFQSGRRGLVAVGGGEALSNDLGIYRIYGVPPGDYIVGAGVGDVGTSGIPGYVRSILPGHGDGRRGEAGDGGGRGGRRRRGFRALAGAYCPDLWPAVRCRRPADEGREHPVAAQRRRVVDHRGGGWRTNLPGWTVRVPERCCRPLRHSG